MRFLVGLALSVFLASAGSTNPRLISRQYDALVRCKAAYGLAKNTNDKRSKMAASNIDAKLEELLHGKSRDQIEADVAARRASRSTDKESYLEAAWRSCRSRYAPLGTKIDRSLTDKLLPTAPRAERLAAADTIAANPEKFSSLLLMMAGDPFIQAGRPDKGRFLFHAGALRASNYMLFIDQHDEQNMVQVFAITRRSFGIRFAADAMTEAREARLAVERVVAWDAATPNPELDQVLDLEDVDRAEARSKIEAQRCNYLASFYFGEAAAAREIEERYDGDAAKFRQAVNRDVFYPSQPIDHLEDWNKVASERATEHFSARQKKLVADAKDTIARNGFGGDMDAFEAKKKTDPTGACALLLAEAKKLVP